ncbi:MAG TPA: hypothetical protein VK983_01025 [Candidatus Limnocylindrales bacterium]|nr:hypothetical protein [Candidatus Limnocylindrales bacterium]
MTAISGWAWLSSMRWLRVFRNRDGLVVFWQNIFINLSTFIFATVLVRLFQPAELSMANSVLGLFLVGNIAIAVIQITTTKLIIRHGSLPDELWKTAVRLGWASSLVVIALFPFWQLYLGWSLLMVLCIAPAIGLLFPLAVRRGALLGRKDYTGYAKSQLVDNVVRLLGLPLAVLFGPAGVAALISVSVLAALLLTPHFAVVKQLTFRVRSLMTAGMSIVLFSITYTVDLILVQYALPPVEAARYGVVNLVGKVPLALGAMVALYFLPIMIAYNEAGRPQAAWKAAAKALLIASGGLVVCIGFLALFGPILVSIVFGTTYEVLGPQLALAVLPFGLLALSGVLLNYFVAVDNRLHTLPLVIFVVFQVTGLLVMHGSYRQVLSYLLVITLVLYVVYMVMFISKKASKK